MAESDEEDHSSMLQGSVELQRFTARSASMSIPLNASYESEDTFITHTGPLHSHRTGQLPNVSGISYMSQRHGNASKLNRDKKYNKSHTFLHEDMGKELWSDKYNDHRNGHLLNSGPLGVCNNPNCVDCPADYIAKRNYYGNGNSLETKLHNILYGDSGGWTWRCINLVNSYFPIMNPHNKVVQKWNKFFVISCLVAIFVDPLFFFLLSVQKEYYCIVFHWSLAMGIAIVRSVTDFIYFLHMFLQFRLAYVAPESRVVGAGDLVDQPKKIAVHYLQGYFLLDLFVVLPLPQVMILVVIPKYVGTSSANYAKNLLRATVLLQYIPRIIRFLPLLAGRSASGFIFESAWANFVINLLMFVLAGHVVGSCWYLFGLQRVNQCLRNACSDSHILLCEYFMDCGRGDIVGKFSSQAGWSNWLNNTDASNCLSDGGNFHYGIYEQAVGLTTEHSVVTRYVYSLFWGFLQISTLAGNLIPSYFVWEVLFTMAIIGLGLLLFALLIGNMQNFLQALGRRFNSLKEDRSNLKRPLVIITMFNECECEEYHVPYQQTSIHALEAPIKGISMSTICLPVRRLEMQLRQRDVEQWMSHRRLPEGLRRKVRQAERFSWAATRGVDEDELLQNLPEDLQRDIRLHFFNFLKKVRLFSLMDDPILDAVFERLKQQLYIRGSFILYNGGPINKMFFIVRGKLESIAADGNVAPLSEGDVCGEELLTWCLEHSSMNKEGGRARLPGQRLLSNRTVRCLTNVEMFSLRAGDLEQVTSLFSRFLRNPRIEGAIRYESPYWRYMAATRIQVAWRYRQKRLKNRRTRSSPAAAYLHHY